MIKEEIVSGRPATVAYFKGAFIPASVVEATGAKVLFSDGKQPSMMMLKLADEAAPELVKHDPIALIKFNPNHDEKGEFSSSSSDISFAEDRAARHETEAAALKGDARPQAIVSSLAHERAASKYHEAANAWRAGNGEAANDAWHAAMEHGVNAHGFISGQIKVRKADLLKYQSDELIKFNPNHDEKGQFSSGPGGGSKAADVRATVPAKFQGLPAKVVQPFNDWPALKAAGAVARDQMMDALDKGSGVVSAMGGETLMDVPVGKEGWDKMMANTKGRPVLLVGPLKSEGRATEKTNLENGGNWNQLLDVARMSIMVDTPHEVQGMLDKLAASGMELGRAPKNRFNTATPDGYRNDFLLNPRMKNGMVTELQVGVKQMFATKDEAHAIYERNRSLVGPYVGVDKSEWPHEVAVNYARNVADMKTAYETSWNNVVNMSTGMGKLLKAQSGVIYVEMDGKYYRGDRTSALFTEEFDGKNWVPSKANSAVVAREATEVPESEVK